MRASPRDGRARLMTGSGSVAGLAGAVGVDPAELTDLVTAFLDRRWTVAAAESLTAGLLTALITEVPGASGMLRGGIVCYATDTKQSLVGVDGDLLARVGPVDPAVAVALATGARDRFAATIGVGLTGVAGPDRQGGRAPGTVFVATMGPGGAVVAELRETGAGRLAVRAAAVRAALRLLRSAVAG